jgi:uncharacterized protein YggT (Ycf19 family)
VHPVADILALAIQVLSYVLLAYILISWLKYWQQTSRSAPRMNLDNPIVRGIESIAYTMLHPIRKVIAPYQRGMVIDFSAIIVFLLLGLVQGWVSRLPF